MKLKAQTNLLTQNESIPSVNNSPILSQYPLPKDNHLAHRGVWELEREGGLHPILSPTKMKVRQNSFDCLSFCSSSCLSASLSACLPVFLPFYLPYGLSCFPIFFLFPLFPSFFLEIYSPTPFTVRRQGGLLDPPDPPSQTPLLETQIGYKNCS